jgi:hypothetical protein
MRKFEAKDLAGKTVESVDDTSVNVIKIVFTDGSTLELWAENAVNTRYGSIPGFFVAD